MVDLNFGPDIDFSGWRGEYTAYSIKDNLVYSYPGKDLPWWMSPSGVGKSGGSAFKWFSGLFKSKGANILKPLGRGSTGRTIPQNLTEKLAMEEIMKNPSNFGKVIPKMKPLSDPRWEGWLKMSNKNAHGVEIHFNALWKDDAIKAVDDFKFID